MDSSPVLRQQSQNKIHSDFARMKNVQNKIPLQPKSSKSLSAPHHSYQNENKDPGNTEISRKAPVRPGVSRLPVLVKSLRLQTPSDFSQSHCKWEEKPLAGKAKKKKPCTRPIPFNLSHPKNSRMATEKEQCLPVSQPRTSSRAVQHNKNTCIALQKTPNSNVKHTKHPATVDSIVDSTKSTGKSKAKNTEKLSQLAGQHGPFSTLKTSAHLLHLPSSISNNTLHQKKDISSAQATVNAEACVDNMSLLSLKDPTKTTHIPQNMQPTEQGTFSKCSTDKEENFQTDHAALLSILRNEGISAAGFGPMTPKPKPYNYLPQRVSVMKSRQKTRLTAGLMKSDQFSPDSAALQSILQNEGVKVGGLVGATPQTSVCPSGRNTSVYTAQRVPARKHQAEANGGPAAVELKESAVKKWTPQRVCNTRHQPISAMKWHLSTQPSPYGGTPGLWKRKANLQPQQEEVVQRLFDDQEDQQDPKATDKEPETPAEQPCPAQATTTKSHSEEKVEMSEANSNKEEEQRIMGGQPFIQAPQRESVIFFSTGKKLLRAPRFEQQAAGSARLQQPDLFSSEQKEVLPAHEEAPTVSGPTCRITPSVLSLHRDLAVQKPCALSSAAAMLRKRLPPLDELRMDEEVATYTSVSVLTASGFRPPRPRCSNPLATLLHFEDSSRFVPIGCGHLSDPASPPGCLLKER